MSLSRDAGTGDFAIEAGALVLADQGETKNRKQTMKSLSHHVSLVIMVASLMSVRSILVPSIEFNSINDF